ncbi:hypothetical protein Tco_0638897, partial [Tanacetum coccineum]
LVMSSDGASFAVTYTSVSSEARSVCCCCS